MTRRTLPDADRRWLGVPAPRPGSTPAPAIAAWIVTAVPLSVSLLRGDVGDGVGTLVRLVGVTAALGVLAHRSSVWRGVAVTLASATGLAVVAGWLVDDLRLGPDGPRSAAWFAAVAGVVALHTVAWSLAADVPGRERDADAPGPGGGRRLAVAALVGADVHLVLTPWGPRAAWVTAAAGAVSLAAVAIDALAPRVLSPLVRASDPVVVPLRRLGGANSRLLDRVGRPLGAALGAVAMVPAAVLASAAWALHRATGHDPLLAPAGPGSAWVRRASADPAGERAFAAVAPIDTAPRRMLPRVVSTVVVLAMVAGITALVADRFEDDPAATTTAADRSADCRRSVADNPVLEGQPHAGEVVCESRDFVRHALFDATTIYRYPDRAGTWVTQRNGVRSGWTAPACDCRRVTVWWYGGSAAWGWGQRDELTLSSQIARVAHERGVTVDVENRAQPGWVLDQEVRAFQQAAQADGPPDVVVFYDGGNELARQKERNGRGRGTDESPTSFLEVELDDFMWNGPLPAGRQPWERPTSHTAGDTISPERVARHAVNRYARDLRLGRRVAERFGVTPVFVWQPLMHSAPRVARRPGAVSRGDDRVWSRMVPAAVGRLPTGVVDLSDALDSATGPVFDDYYHTNEAAARTVAEQLTDAIWPQLTAAAASPERTP